MKDIIIEFLKRHGPATTREIELEFLAGKTYRINSNYTVKFSINWGWANALNVVRKLVKNGTVRRIPAINPDTGRQMFSYSFKDCGHVS